MARIERPFIMSNLRQHCAEIMSDLESAKLARNVNLRTVSKNYEMFSQDIIYLKILGCSKVRATDYILKKK